MDDIKRNKNYFVDYLILYREEMRGKAIKLSNHLIRRGFVVETDLYDNDVRLYIKKSTFRNTKEIIKVEEEFVIIIDIYKDQTKKYNANQFYKILDCNEAIASIH